MGHRILGSLGSQREQGGWAGRETAIQAKYVLLMEHWSIRGQAELFRYVSGLTFVIIIPSPKQVTCPRPKLKSRKNTFHSYGSKVREGMMEICQERMKN